ncbi:MAG: hypothetical protein ACI8RD_014934 [Bacillariaceae sp.]|jgi:hypothetical protein
MILNLKISFMKYNYTEQIKLQVEINYYDTLMDVLSDDIPMSLWPNIFARIQQRTKIIKKSNNNNSSSNDERSTSHIYRLLQTGTGSYGQLLSLRIALAHNYQKSK